MNDRSLTLDQVKAAGRFAYCRMSDTFYAEGAFWTAYQMADEVDGPLGAFDECEPCPVEYVERDLGYNWEHLPGCDCGICRDEGP